MTFAYRRLFHALNGFPRRNWDSHEDIAKDHGEMGRPMDKGCAALLVDLKKRGLLDDTLVLWTTEFGRMPCSQGSKGRDHLHLLGIDHERLTVRHNGIDRRLTDVHGHVIRELLA